MTLLVVVTGPPASGKTTIAQRLAEDFTLPLVTKDGLKETLFGALGIGDRDWSGKLGAASFELIWYVVERELRAGRSLAIEANFRGDDAAARIARLRETYRFDVLQIHCRAPRDVLRDRYATRDRHPGHLDDERLLDIADRLDPQDYLLPLADETLSLDTTDAEEAYAAARDALSRRA